MARTLVAAVDLFLFSPSIKERENGGQGRGASRWARCWGLFLKQGPTWSQFVLESALNFQRRIVLIISQKRKSYVVHREWQRTIFRWLHQNFRSFIPIDFQLHANAEDANVWTTTKHSYLLFIFVWSMYRLIFVGCPTGTGGFNQVTRFLCTNRRRSIHNSIDFIMRWSCNFFAVN